MESDDTPVNCNLKTPNAIVSPPKIKTKIKIEPITIKKCTNYLNIISHIEGKIINKTTKKILKGDTVKIFPETTDDHNSIQKYLSDNLIEHFRIVPKSERPRKVLLRGILPETPVETVKAELIKKSFEINRVS